MFYLRQQHRKPDVLRNQAAFHQRRLPTNAIYGFLNILLKARREEGPDCLAVAFDLKAPTFRHTMFEGIKAQRKPMPEELARQMPY
jgi:5'-3' exonuclease